MITQTISDNDSDIRLDRWFKRHYPALPHSMLEKYLRKGSVRVDGKKAKSSDRIIAGQELSFPDLSGDFSTTKPKPVISEYDAKFIRSLVIHHDDNIIVINKPFGLAVQGGSKVKQSVDGLLVGLSAPNGDKPKLVHRLDKDTSGVLVLAKNSKTAATLSKMFAGKDIEKTYLALVNGCPQQAAGTIDHRLVKSVQGEGSYERVAVNDEDGKYAVTEYLVLEAIGRKYALMQLSPLTGRTHQLRVHMQSIYCPIVGDEKYGGQIAHGPDIGVSEGLHLHAKRIVIPAFGSNKKIDVSAPLPPHMKESFKALGISTK